MDAIQTQRALKALAATVLLVVLSVGACALGSCGRNAGSSGSDEVAAASETSGSALLEAVLRGDGGTGEAVPEQVMESRGAVALPEMLPLWFETEVLPRSFMGPGYCARDGEVVGFSLDGSANEVLERLAGAFRERGWVGYESGLDGVATFRKEEGACRWMLVSCTQMPDTTSVVIRVQRV